MDLICFFMQKTAEEMHISDWSSDVCSSDLPRIVRAFGRVANAARQRQLVDRPPVGLPEDREALAALVIVGVDLRETRILVEEGGAELGLVAQIIGGDQPAEPAPARVRSPGLDRRPLDFVGEDELVAAERRAGRFGEV